MIINGRYSILIVLFLFLNTPSFSQISDLIYISADKVEVKADALTEGTVHVMIEEGYHIQSNVIVDDYIIPTKLDIKGNEFIQLIEVEYPKDKEFELKGSEIKLMVFDGDIDIKYKLKANSGDSQGEHNLEAILHYQACDDKSCFAPRSIEFLIPAEVIN